MQKGCLALNSHCLSLPVAPNLLYSLQFSTTPLSTPQTLQADALWTPVVTSIPAVCYSPHSSAHNYSCTGKVFNLNCLKALCQTQSSATRECKPRVTCYCWIFRYLYQHQHRNWLYRNKQKILGKLINIISAADLHAPPIVLLPSMPLQSMRMHGLFYCSTGNTKYKAKASKTV